MPTLNILRPSLIKKIAAVVLVLGSSACASMGRASFANPIVELKDVKVRGIGTKGGTLDVVLDVYNPNGYRLDTSGFTYTLWIDSSSVATGQVTRLVTLETKKKTEVTLPLTFTIKELQNAARAMTDMGSVNYRLVGDLTVSTPAGSFTRPYEGRGTFNSASLIPR